MKLNFNDPIKDIEGRFIPETAEPNSPNATLGKICVNALLATDPQENADGAEKFARYNLAKKISDSVNADKVAIDVTAEDITKLKTLTGKLYQAGVVGPVYAMFENLA